MWPFRKRIRRICGISCEHYEEPIFVKVDKKTHNKFKHIKDVKFIWNDPETGKDIPFGYDDLKVDKKVILENNLSGEYRVGTIISCSRNMPPIFDDIETLIEYNIIAIEL